MRESTTGRVRRSAAEWRTLCERFTRSGLGVAEFCAREAIAESRFKKWYQRSQGAAIASRAQNSATPRPLRVNRSHSVRHSAALRRTFPFVLICIASSSKRQQPP